MQFAYDAGLTYVQVLTRGDLKTLNDTIACRIEHACFMHMRQSFVPELKTS